MNDFIEMLVVVLQNTNAAMTGCNLLGTTMPDSAFLRERYVYSLFALDLQRCPDVFHGDFEDDIEYRLKCRQMGRPVVQVCAHSGITKQGRNREKTSQGAGRSMQNKE